MIDSIFRYRSTYIIGKLFYVLRSISHGNTCTDSLQHLYVIMTVPEGQGTRSIQLIVGDDFLNGLGFSTSGRNHIRCPIPGECDVHALCVPDNIGMIRFPAAEHNLVDRFLTSRGKIL